MSHSLPMPAVQAHHVPALPALRGRPPGAGGSLAEPEADAHRNLVPRSSGGRSRHRTTSATRPGPITESR